MATGLQLNLVYVRHAHSHLMAFGWIMPAFMLLIQHHLPSCKGFKGWIAFTLVTGLASFPVFWLWGYDTTSIGGVRLPLSVVLSTLNMLGWYGFMANYLWVTRRTRRTASLMFFDLAQFFLFLASLGAWAISLVHRFPALQIEPKLLSHFFLFVFKEGWCVTAIAGLLIAELGVRRSRGLWLAWIALALGVPISFLIEVPRFLWLGLQGGVLSSLGLLTLLLIACRHRRPPWQTWLPAMVYLAIKALILLVVCLLGRTDLGSFHAYRLGYIHVLMLGAITTGLLAHGAALGYLNAKDLWPWHGAAALLLFSLVLTLPSLWPGLLLVKQHGLSLAAVVPGLVGIYLLRPVQRQPSST